jgi:CDP-4-dehydro-6-deoxyglucose reductase
MAGVAMTGPRQIADALIAAERERKPIAPFTDAETVLGAVMRSGFRYRFGCRRGGCGICKVRLILGEVRYERPVAASVLSDEERAVGVCLSCRAVPITDVIVELQEGDRLRQASPFGLKLPGH